MRSYIVDLARNIHERTLVLVRFVGGADVYRKNAVHVTNLVDGLQAGVEQGGVDGVKLRHDC
jgi:hypothetical protein